ncbi:MAG: beta-galactosidase [Armatimonadota bacterium]
MVFLLYMYTVPAASADPKVSYTALSNEARSSGQLDIYKNSLRTTGRIAVDGYILSYSMPSKLRAYDVVPISYRLHQPANSRRVAVEAVASEDQVKAKGRALYDMSIPGDLSVNVEYLGSVSADYDYENYIWLTKDPKTPVSPFPPFKRDPLVRSSTIRSAEAVWFKFRITNNGSTILDPEGLGAALSYPQIVKIGVDGKDEWSAGTINTYERQMKYIYPGESYDQWVQFNCPKFDWPSRGLLEGDYRIDYTMLYRSNQKWEWGPNIWHGKEFAKLSVPIKVTKNGGVTPVQRSLQITDTSDKMPGWLDRFEQFMTTFVIHEPVNHTEDINDTMYLQVAPWTKKVELKLILTNPNGIKIARIPVSVSDVTMKVKYNPKNPMVLKRNGKEEPVIMVQALPGMRTGFQLGPYAEDHMRAEIMEMKALGVNVITNTCGNWWAAEVGGSSNKFYDYRKIDPLSAAYKYWYDTLVRENGMTTMGWSVFPLSATWWYDWAEPLFGKKVNYSTIDHFYQGMPGVDLGDPIVPEVLAAWVNYIYSRWGDTWFKTKDGRVPIDLEDTWGWLRDDANTRYTDGPMAVAKFRVWLQRKYGSIQKVNEAWRTDFKDLAEVNPESKEGLGADDLLNQEFYNRPDRVFHDWTPAMEDWDRFRTELRMDLYRKTNEILRKTIPGAEIALRTESGGPLIKSDSKSPSMHLRHAYYTQRRNALVYDAVKKQNVLHFYADYTTLPYTLTEWRSAMKQMASDGITPSFFPQFNNMRDIVLNPYYGRDYQVSYNLDEPAKGVMVHCLMAAYPYWKATYEAGGAPATSWADYTCDAFVTETQKKEIKLLREHFNTMEKPVSVRIKK